jgi:hypothetical protein
LLYCTWIQSKKVSVMVKADPAVPMAGIVVGLYAFIALMYSILALEFISLRSTLGNSLGTLSIIIASAILYLGIFALYIAILVNLTRQERRRKGAAATSMQQRMALSGQPMPSLPPLEMPFTLRLRPNWLWMSLLFGSLLLIYFVLFISFVASTFSSSTIPQDASIVIVPLVVVMSIFISLLAIVAFSLRQRIEINPYGITVLRGISKKSMYWETAVLFAQVRVTPARREVKRMAQYELADIQTLMRFIVPRTWWSPMVPQGMTREEYDRQMALLMHYISIRTGLPLVDVR